ncbi:hypothetical protein CH63R_02647 [Colletotrichum higginsianum IMI 349063]|uniref:Uncharacterized protein n=1 Tax=Colletotrichum higginsianum (strain IMI 349063) TaxID=759273 RepID=A0A1B7YPD5_COLHI|nr:hypothetical protein CH63R_02647 [Colletotrichum higginsianum IMI 349063]OBR13921.1 hypothetical protein CH63R_02647 [Colletotrichum higginsianum IMI 349063]
MASKKQATDLFLPSPPPPLLLLPPVQQSTAGAKSAAAAAVMQDAAILGGLAADGPGDAGRENLPNIDYPSSRSTAACTLKTDWSTLW